MSALLIFLGIVLGMSALGLLFASLRPRNPYPLLRPAGIGLAVVGFLFFVLGLCIVSVAPNERMVVFNRVSGELGKPKAPGLHLVNPFTTSYKIYDVSRQTYTMSSINFEGEVSSDDAVPARTSDGQEVFVDITVIYTISPERVNEVHQKWPNERYRTELVRPQIRSIVRDVISLFSVESVYQERDTVDERISERMTERITPEGLELVEILVRDVNFTEEYAQAIEDAQIAEVRIREEEFRIQEVEKQAEQEEARAEGLANARVIEAEGEAKALQLIADIIAENPALLQYQYVTNLSDNVQIIALPANSPYIFDLQSLTQNADEDIPLPAATEESGQ